MKWDDVQDQESRSRQRWEDELGLYLYGKKKGFKRMRLMGDPVAAYYHWIRIRTQEGKTVSVPVTCPKFDPLSGKFRKKKKCLACMIIVNLPDYDIKDKVKDGIKKRLRSSRVYFSNAIIRGLQNTDSQMHLMLFSLNRIIVEISNYTAPSKTGRDLCLYTIRAIREILNCHLTNLQK